MSRRKKTKMMLVQFSADGLRRAATVINDELWDRYYAPVFGTRENALVMAAAHLANRRPMICIQIKQAVYEKALQAYGEEAKA